MMRRIKRWGWMFAGCLLFSGVQPTRLGADEDDFPEIYDSPSEQGLAPMPAEQAAATFRVPDGFQVRLFAAEPDVQNPIAMCWDDRGRMWVAENYTYAESRLRFDLRLRDRVLIFEDADQDGRAEKRVVFTDQVQMLTSVEVGQGGVWLMCPPQLLFIPDRDQDDRADGPAEVILDGFTVAEGNYHNFANGLRWGPDGWLYGRCGHSCPGLVGRPGVPASERIPIHGGIWRYHPRHRRFEVISHGTVNPWGHDWDRHGELFFINTVIGHLWHAIPGAHFRESWGESRNPEIYERMEMIADHYHYDTRGSWTDSRDGKANEFGGGHAHIGMMIYQGDHWPTPYRDRLFTLNMHGRRANVERLERLGAGYVGKHEPDFLFAEDPFFRGMEISQGGDGNVYLLDWSDTGECHEHTGVHRHSGRIYKIEYRDQQAAGKVAKPQCLAGPGALPELWKSYQQGTLTPAMLRERLADEDEHVRVWAIRLLTDLWPLDTLLGPLTTFQYPEDPQTWEKLLAIAQDDPSGLVQMTLASTLQRVPLPRRSELASRLVARPLVADDRDLPKMIWYGLYPLADRAPADLVRVAEVSRSPSLRGWIARALATRVEQQPAALDELLVMAAKEFPPSHRVDVVRGMHSAWRGWQSVPQPAAWNHIREAIASRQGATPEIDALVDDLDELFGSGRSPETLREILADRGAPPAARRRALESLTRERPAGWQQLCLAQLGDRSLNLVAARRLAEEENAEVPLALVKNFAQFESKDQPAVLEILVSRPAFAQVLLEHIGSGGGKIAPAQISVYHARQIVQHGDPELQQKLAEVWGEIRETSAEKGVFLARYREQLTPARLAEANLGNGRVLFQKSCSTCHRLFGDGGEIGPELTGAQRGSLDYLLENLLDPSAVVSAEYRMRIVVTNDGRVLSGLLVREDAKVVELQTPFERLLLPMDQVAEIRQSPLSPMPEGILESLSENDVRDLVGYLMQPQQVPLPVSSN